MANNWVKRSEPELTDWQIFTNNGNFNCPLPPSKRFNQRCVFYTLGTNADEIRQRSESSRSRSK